MTLRLPDPDDEPFLHIAQTASADYLVTGNMADFPADKCGGTRVITPADFLALWRRLHSAPD